jgi:hypothetical protein
MFKMYVNITLTSARYVPNTLFSSRFAVTVLCAMLLSSQTCPSVLCLSLWHLLKFANILSSQFYNFSNFLLRPPTFPNTVFRALFSNTFIPYSSLSVSPILIKQARMLHILSCSSRSLSVVCSHECRCI